MMFKTNHALIGALLSTTVLAGTAEAAPIYRNWDENGVDVVQGDFRLDFTEASIGSGKAMRVLQRVNNSLAPSQWDLIRFQRTSNGTTVTTRITMADGSDEVFTGFTNTKKDGGTLTQNSDGTFTYKDRNDVAYLFYNPEPGTATDFCGSSSGYPCELLLQSITSADLSTTTLTWDVVGSGTNHDWRLRKVANSYAFSIDFTYQSNTPGSTAWSRRTSAAFVRGASTIHTVSYAYPSSGVTDITDPTNNVWRITATSIKRPTETTPGFIVTQSGGVVTAVTDDGVTTAYSRQVSGNMVTLTKTDPLNNQTVIVSDLAKARPTAITDPLGHTTQYRYDSDGRLEKITLPEGNGIELSELDDRGNSTETRITPKSGSTAPAIVYTTEFPEDCPFPNFCNKISKFIDPAENITSYFYSSVHGGVELVSQPAAGGVSPVTRYGYTQVFDEYQLTSVSRCQDGTSPCAGDADETKSTFTYDSTGNLTSVSQGNGTGTLTATTTMNPNTRGDIVAVDGPLPGTDDIYRYRYDAARRLIRAETPDPDGTGALKPRAVSITYSPAGLVTKVQRGTLDAPDDWATFAVLEILDITYDSNSRPATRKLSGGGSAHALTQLSYDELGRLQCIAQRMNPAAFGSLPGSACSLGTEGAFGPDRLTRLYYDAAGRHNKTLVGYQTADEAFLFQKIFSPNGQLSYLFDGKDNRTTYTYDDYDRLSQTRFPDQAGTGTSSTTDYEQLSYDTRSNVTSRRLRDGTSIAFTYDALNRFTLKNLPAGGGPDVAYAYDNLGRLKSASQTGMSLSFTYDALGRNLTQTGPQGTVCSEWDLGGRRSKLSIRRQTAPIQAPSSSPTPGWRPAKSATCMKKASPPAFSISLISSTTSSAIAIG